MLRDQSGASAAEYALILSGVGLTMVLAATTLGFSIKKPMSITAYGPDGTAYACTNNCSMEDKDYCAAIMHRGTATFSPTLPAGAKCNGETPVS